MARIRSVKPEFWVDRSFVRKVPNRDARMLYMALWNLADEHARLMGDPAYIKGQAFPYAEDDDLTPKVIDELLDMLADAERVVRYEVDGDPYLFLPRLAKHQRLESAKVPSRLPPPPDPDDPAPRPDKSAPDPDGTAPNAVLPSEAESTQVGPPSGVRADKSARDSDESARGADKSALLYVAGCIEQVAGSKEQTPAQPETLFDADPTVPGAADAGKPRGASKKSRKTPAEPKPKPPADELTDAFWEVHGKGQAQSWVAIRGIVRTCLGNEIPRNDLARALDLLARQGKAISGGTIQNALTEVRRPLQLLPGGASIPSPRQSATARALAEADRAGEEAKRLIYGSAG